MKDLSNMSGGSEVKRIKSCLLENLDRNVTVEKTVLVVTEGVAV